MYFGNWAMARLQDGRKARDTVVNSTHEIYLDGESKSLIFPHNPLSDDPVDLLQRVQLRKIHLDL